MINEEVRHIIEPELEAGEKLLWADRPSRGHYAYIFLPGVIIGAIFVLIGSGVLLNFVATKEGLLPVIFMIIWTGGAGLIGISCLKLFLAPSSQVYGLTPRRAIILEKSMWGRTSSLYKTEFSRIERSGNDRIGSLVFGSTASIHYIGLNFKLPLNTFGKIKNPRDVEALCRKIFTKEKPHE